MATHLTARWLAAVVVLAYAGITAHVGDVLTATDRQVFDHSPEQYGLAYENVTFTSRADGLQLSGWLLVPPDGSQAGRPVIVVHGWKRDRQSELDSRVLEVAAHLVRTGRLVLVFDLRGWGRSEGDRFSMGPQEARDVGGAIDFLSRRGLAADGVDLLGYSMGAGAMLLDAPTEPNVRAVAADSGYADLASLLNEQVPKYSGLPPLFTPGAVLAASFLTGVNWYTVRPVDGVATLAARGVPLLIIHGEADTLVPISHARRLAAAYGQRAETFFVPGAEHVGAFKAETTAYLKRLDDFFHRAAGAPIRQ
jgi:pimeloyl-ACP methyl ester carboxylesterase